MRRMSRCHDERKSPAIPTVHETLDVLTIEQLKPLVALLPTEEDRLAKELVALIEQYLSGKRLRALWEQLDETQKLAVAETIHYENGVFNPHRLGPSTAPCQSSARRKRRRGTAKSLRYCGYLCTGHLATVMELP